MKELPGSQPRSKPQKRKRAEARIYFLAIALIITGCYFLYHNLEAAADTLEELINKFFYVPPIEVDQDKVVSIQCDMWQKLRLVPPSQMSQKQNLKMGGDYQILIERVGLDSINIQVKDEHNKPHYSCMAQAFEKSTRKTANIDIRCNKWFGSEVKGERGESQELAPEKIEHYFEETNLFQLHIGKEKTNPEVKFKVAGRGNTSFDCRILGQ